MSVGVPLVRTCTAERGLLACPTRKLGNYIQTVLKWSASYRGMFQTHLLRKEPLLSTQDQCSNQREEQSILSHFLLHGFKAQLHDDFLQKVITYLEGYTYQVSMYDRGSH